MTSDFTPTHTVPATGLDAWEQPDPSLEPIATLDSSSPVELLERRRAWAHVRREDGLEAWTNASPLIPIARAVRPPPPPPPPALPPQVGADARDASPRSLTAKRGLLLAAGVLALAALAGGIYALTRTNANTVPRTNASTIPRTNASRVSSSGLAAPGGTPAQGVALADLHTATQQIIATTSRVEANPRDPDSWDRFSRAAQQASNALSSTAWPPTVQSLSQRLAETVSALSADAVRVAADLRSRVKAGTDAGQFEKDFAAYVAASSKFSQATKNAGLG